jgi:hypothetical protein
MDTVELTRWGVFRGTHYGSVGVYTNKDGHTYAGERKGDVAHGHGVVTYDGNTYSGQFADGDWHGHREVHWADGDVYYGLWECGKSVHYAHLRPNGDCFYDNQPCGADYAGHLALKAAAQQAGVRTRPYPHSTQARAVGRTATHAPFGFRARSVLVPGLGPRLWACVCKCARVCG